MLEVLDEIADALGKRFEEPGVKAVVIPHLNPDGDAAGASSALFQAMRYKGVDVKILVPDGFPEYLMWLNGLDEAVSCKMQPELCRKLLKSARIIFMIDHNTAKREGELEVLRRMSGAEVVMIDHHPFPEEADYRISDTTASSTCELMYDFIRKLWGKDCINADMANALYTGINTDTGGFSHNSSNPHTYRIVADLLELGLDKDKVHDYIYRMNKLSRLRLIGYLLARKLEILPGYPLALTSVTGEELRAYGYREGDLEGFVNTPLSVKEILVSVLVTEREGNVRLSFRSKGNLPVNKWANEYFNGGGHLSAAGGRVEESLCEVVDRLKRTAPWFFNEICKTGEILLDL